MYNVGSKCRVNKELAVRAETKKQLFTGHCVRLFSGWCGHKAPISIIAAVSTCGVYFRGRSLCFINTQSIRTPFIFLVQSKIHALCSVMTFLHLINKMCRMWAVKIIRYLHVIMDKKYLGVKYSYEECRYLRKIKI